MWCHVIFRLLVVSSASLALTWFLYLPRCSERDRRICTCCLCEMPVMSVRTWIWTACFPKNSQRKRNRTMNCLMRTDRPRSVVPTQCVSARLDRLQVGLFCIVSVIGSTPAYAFMACRGTTVLCECFRLLMPPPAVLQADSWSGTRRGMLTLSDQHVLFSGTLGQRMFPVVILEW